MHKNLSFSSALRNALNGLRSLLKQEINARYHLAATILVIVVAAFLHLSTLEWILIIGVIFLVWIAELINTIFENLYDLINPEIDSKVKIGKDMSAAAVLLAAALSVIVGLLILGPALLRAFKLIPG